MRSRRLLCYLSFQGYRPAVRTLASGPGFGKHDKGSLSARYGAMFSVDHISSSSLSADSAAMR